MKNIIILFISILILAGCGTAERVIGTDGKPLSKEESAKITQKTIVKMVENRDYRILVDRMYPMRGPSLILRDNDWALEIHRDSIGSVLPYFGRGYNVPYGTAMGLHFITRIDSYTEEKVKDGHWRIAIRCHTQQDGYDFNVEVYDNGSAFISVTTNYREPISFSGKIDVRDLYLKKVN